MVKQIVNWVRKILFRLCFKKLLKWQGMALITGPAVYFYYRNMKLKKLVHYLQAADDWYLIPNHDAYLLFRKKKKEKRKKKKEKRIKINPVSSSAK